MSVDQFEEANQKWKYSNERTSESCPKVEATAMGSSRQEVESRAEKGAVMIVQVFSSWFASFYSIRRAFLQHIIINERVQSCHFA